MHTIAIGFSIVFELHAIVIYEMARDNELLGRSAHSERVLRFRFRGERHHAIPHKSAHNKKINAQIMIRRKTWYDDKFGCRPERRSRRVRATKKRTPDVEKCIVILIGRATVGLTEVWLPTHICLFIGRIVAD